MSTVAKYWRYRFRDRSLNDNWTVTDHAALIERMDAATWEYEELFTKNQLRSTKKVPICTCPPGPAPGSKIIDPDGSIWYYTHSGHRADCSPVDPVADRINAARYYRLRGWMSSNVPEGWERVENLGAIACYVDWNNFDRYLDDLGVCNVGLMQKAPNAKVPVQLLKHQSEMEDIRQLAEEAGCTPLPNEHVRKTNK